jgi:spermidine/putrescine transport system permease protein
MARLSEFDYSIIEAARDLGAKERDILFRIVIPISMPGILSGFLTAFTLSLEDFVVTLFVQGPNSQTLPLYIYAHVKKGLPPEVNAFSVILIVFTMLLMFSVRNLLKYMVKSK